MPTTQPRRSRGVSDTPLRRRIRGVPCPRCKAVTNQWCRSVSGESRISSHRERVLASGYRPANFRPEPKPAPVSDEKRKLYDEQRQKPCLQCGAWEGKPCIGERGTPIQSCHVPRYKAWKFGGDGSEMADE